jgi:hypothetical protein
MVNTPPYLLHFSCTTDAFGKLIFTLDATGKLHILWHDGPTLCMKCTCIAVFKESNHAHLSGLLEGKHGNALEANVLFH